MKWNRTELYRGPDQLVIGELLMLVAKVSEKVLSPHGASPS